VSPGELWCECGTCADQAREEASLLKAFRAEPRQGISVSSWTEKVRYRSLVAPTMEGEFFDLTANDQVIARHYSVPGAIVAPTPSKEPFKQWMAGEIPLDEFLRKDPPQKSTTWTSSSGRLEVQFTPDPSTALVIRRTNPAPVPVVDRSDWTSVDYLAPIQDAQDDYQAARRLARLGSLVCGVTVSGIGTALVLDPGFVLAFLLVFSVLVSVWTLGKARSVRLQTRTQLRILEREWRRAPVEAP
jgi:hypothetical protein